MHCSPLAGASDDAARSSRAVARHLADLLHPVLASNMMSKLPPSPFLSSAEAVAPSVEPAVAALQLSPVNNYAAATAGTNSESHANASAEARPTETSILGRQAGLSDGEAAISAPVAEDVSRLAAGRTAAATSEAMDATARRDEYSVSVPIGISVIGHNPITQAVEIRPVSNSGRVEGDCSGIKRGVNPTQGGESSIRDRTSGLPDATAGETATNHIAEIFIGAGKIDDRRAEDFVDWPALERRIASR